MLKGVLLFFVFMKVKSEIFLDEPKIWNARSCNGVLLFMVLFFPTIFIAIVAFHFGSRYLVAKSGVCCRPTKPIASLF